MIDFTLKEYQTAHYIYLAYSGGLDSSVLLHSFLSHAPKEMRGKIKALHVNHSLSKHAKTWQAHCQAMCQQWQVPLQVITVDATPYAGESLEAKARTLRYQAFAKCMQKEDCLLTAHHEDDQIETFFLQLFRGAGVKGLSAMPPIKALAPGYLIRPLLNYPRAHLLNYAQEHNLSWIDDESNFDTNLQRNFLRHKTIPHLKSLWPGLNKSMLRSISLCQEANELVTALAQIDYTKVLEPQNTLNTQTLLTLSSARRLNCLRHWITLSGFPLPSQARLLSINNHVIEAQQEACPLVTWPQTEVRRYRNRLYISKPIETIKHLPEKINWQDPHNDLYIKALNKTLPANSLKGYTIKNQSISIRFRHQLKKVSVKDRIGHHTLKNLYQENNIPPWLRDRTPMLFIDDEFVAFITN